MPNDENKPFTAILYHQSECWSVASPCIGFDAADAARNVARYYITDTEDDGKEPSFAAEEMAIVAMLPGHIELKTMSCESMSSEQYEFVEGQVQIRDLCEAMIEEDAPIPPLASFEKRGSHA